MFKAHERLIDSCTTALRRLVQFEFLFCSFKIKRKTLCSISFLSSQIKTVLLVANVTLAEDCDSRECQEGRYVCVAAIPNGASVKTSLCEWVRSYNCGANVGSEYIIDNSFHKIK